MSSALQFSVASDLYLAGHDDDGTPFHAERWYVVAEDAAGNRWAHRSSFAGCLVQHYNDESGCGTAFTDVRAAAEAKAERLLARIEAAGGRIDLAYWDEERPVYGSRAYQSYGQYDDVLTEKKEAEEERFGRRA